MIDDSEIPVQMNETVFNSNNNSESNDVGMLILEELRCFRKEMREEVKKLQANVHNFLFSKADIVNAILGTSSLFSEIDKLVDTNVMEHYKPFKTNDLNVPKQVDENRRTIIKFQPTRVEVVKPTLQRSNSCIEASSLSSESNKETKNSSMSTSESSTSSNNTATKMVGDIVSSKSDGDLPKMEVQVLQFNGDSSADAVAHQEEDGDEDKDYPSSSKKHLLPKNYSSIQLKRRIAMTSSLSGLSIPHKAILLPHHATPKLPSKYNQYIGKLKTIRSLENHQSSNRKFAMKVKHKCKFCERSFVSSNDLKRHIRVHTGDRPFQCTECSKAYTRNDHLKRHMKQKHLQTVINVAPSPSEKPTSLNT